MSSSDKGPQAVVLPFVLFVLTILPALGLLLAAGVVYLSQLFGSAILSCVLVGVLLLLIALIVYFALLRGVIRRMQERLEMIYETSRVLHSGFDWVNDQISRFWS